MKIGPTLRSVAASPYTYVFGFSAVGASSIVAGIALLAGAGFALLSVGAFLLIAAAYITRGLKPSA